LGPEREGRRWVSATDLGLARDRRYQCAGRV